MKYFKILGISSILVSCSTEKVNLSPVYETFTDSKPALSERVPETFSRATDRNFYASELINQVATFPKFNNTALNNEVSTLKVYIKQYVYSIQEYNIVNQQKSLRNLEKSYKKIQKLRSYLPKDENETINRYLVRIKSNIAQLEAAKHQENLSTN